MYDALAMMGDITNAYQRLEAEEAKQRAKAAKEAEKKKKAEEKKAEEDEDANVVHIPLYVSSKVAKLTFLQ